MGKKQKITVQKFLTKIKCARIKAITSIIIAIIEFIIANGIGQSIQKKAQNKYISDNVVVTNDNNSGDIKSVEDLVKEYNNMINNTNKNDNSNININNSEVKIIFGSGESLPNEVTIENNGISNSKSSFEATTIVGKDLTGKTYIAKDLVGKKLILIYDIVDGKKVYFWGKYNENYHWEGECITNSFNNDGTFFGACKSNFDDGNRLDYTSLYQEDDAEWIYTKRKVDGNINRGISKTYYCDSLEIKPFVDAEVTVDDLKDPEYYLEISKFQLKKYYSGDTSNGRYNDNTGNAYEVIYDNDGFIKTLYVGGFLNGFFDDDTNLAWDIAYSERMGEYLYHKGRFKNGHGLDTDETEIVDKQQINEILKDKNFECELKWK